MYNKEYQQRYRSQNRELYLQKGREYREKNRERERERSSRYRENNPLGSLITRAKARAKKYDIEFNITIEDLDFPEICPVLGVSLLQSKNKASDNSPSLDRIDNTKGYIKGNVRVISWKANRLKNDASLEELQKIVEDLESIQCSLVTDPL